jgi:hypothetical protein
MPTVLQIGPSRPSKVNNYAWDLYSIIGKATMCEENSSALKRPYFFWDYNITEEQIREILHGNNEVEKAWIITRILEYARWEDIWRYLTVDDVKENFDRLNFRWPHVRELWAYALEVWSGNG